MTIEPVAHMYPSDLERFAESETFATAFSVAVGNPDERSVPLYLHPPAPAWHDAPTAPGLWIASYSYKVRKLDEHDIAHLATLPFKQRWHGPIPADKEQSA